MGGPVTRWRVHWRWGLAAALLLGLAAAVLRLLPGERDLAWERIQAEGRWRIATDASYPPFSAVDADGNLFGFDVDLAEEIGRRWGVRTEFENITYDALLTTLVVGRDDAVISAFVPQPARLKEAAYSQAYFTAGTVAVIRAADGRPLTGDPEAWSAGQAIAVEYGAAGDALARQWARRVAGVTVLPQSTAGDALLAVESGAASAALVDAVSALEFLRGRPALRLAGPPVAPEPYVIAVSAQSPELLRQVNAALGALEADRTLDSLRVKWFGEAAVN
jgi:cystine transport system substrate-binding protein